MYMRSYAARVRTLLSPPEQRLFSRLSSPQRVQDLLDSLPINFEPGGITYMSPIRTLQTKVAHCFEGALLAASIFAYNGRKPLLMDLRTAPNDDDHVIALFAQNGRWGAISKTNHSILKYRDPIYRSPRELAASYFHEYIMDDGAKTLREYSAPFDLSRYAPEKWVTAGEELHWLVEALDNSRHFPLAPEKNLKTLRKASAIELRELKETEWPEPLSTASADN